MNFANAFKVGGVWIAILALAIANGIVRESVLIPVFDKPLAMIISGLLLCAIIIVVAYLALPWFGRRSFSSYVIIGLTWLCLTVMFEIAFGRLVQDKSWTQLFEAYQFRDGNLWPVVLLVTAIAPVFAAKIRKLFHNDVH